MGCVLLEMLLATPLWELEHDFGTKSLEDQNFISHYISEHPDLKKYDPKLLSILKRMLHPDPIFRLTIEEFFRKKFIRKQLNKVNSFMRRKEMESLQKQNSMSSEEYESESLLTIED